MYIPRIFREERIERMHALMQENPLGLLISHGSRGLQVSPMPFLLIPDEGVSGVLCTHMSRANPQWHELEMADECVVMFQGANGYVSPSWYPSKAETHRVAPTWNYIAIEVRGKPVVVQDPVRLQQRLASHSAFHEGRRPQPWSLNDAPADFLADQMKAIVGIEIPIRHLEGKWKMSQNRMESDRQGVVAGMQDPLDPHHDALIAKLVQESQR